MAERKGGTRGEVKREEILFQQDAFGLSGLSKEPIPPRPSFISSRQILASVSQARRLPSAIPPIFALCDPLRIPQSLIAAAGADKDVEDVLLEEQECLRSACLNDILDTGTFSEDPGFDPTKEEDDSAEPFL